MSETELMQQPKSEALEELNNRLGALKGLADSLTVTDALSYSSGGALKLDIQAFVKAVKFRTGPEIEIAKERLRKLQAEEKMLLSPAESLVEAVEAKRRLWANEERRKAEEEQRRINDERRIEAQRQPEVDRKERERQAEIDRKAREKEIEAQRKAGEIKAKEADRLKKEAVAAQERERVRAAEDAKKAAENMPQATVRPNIPVVAGTRNTVNYRFEITDPSKVRRDWLKPDEVAIGQKVRADKDPELSMREIGGIRAWKD